MDMTLKSTQLPQRGFSLVELLIAMTLGLILIASMVAVFSGNKRSSELNAATANLQESARYALEQISRDARIAGYMGCLTEPTAVNVIADTAPSTDLLRTAVTGSVAVDSLAWSPALPGFPPPTTNPAKAGTHVLLLQYAGPDSTKLTQKMPTPSANIQTLDDNGLALNDLAVISNCEFGSLFQISNIGGTGTGTVTEISHAAAANSNTGAFNRAYGDAKSIRETRVMKFNSNIYFIGANGEQNDSGQNLFYLYQQSLPYNSVNNPPVELVTGVENFRVTYGVSDNVTGGVRFVTADSPLFNPARVNSIRIGLLMVSYDEVAEIDDTNTYNLAGIPITPATAANTGADTHPVDRRIRLAFTTTIQIRNRRNL